MVITKELYDGLVKCYPGNSVPFDEVRGLDMYEASQQILESHSSSTPKPEDSIWDSTEDYIKNQTSEDWDVM